MSPITKASGTKRIVLARFARNRRLGDALFLQAFAALNNSPGARAFYDRQRARGATHYQVSAYYLICRSPYDLTCRSAS